MFLILGDYLFVSFWLHWAFAAAWGLSLIEASRGYSSLRCLGFSLRWRLLWSAGSRCVAETAAAPRFWGVGSVAVEHRFNCSAACGIFPGQGLNLCPLRWQEDSYPLDHQGSPNRFFFFFFSSADFYLFFFDTINVHLLLYLFFLILKSLIPIDF